MGVLFVSELGTMHRGEKSLAYEMIRAASESGASIAKFQFGWTREAQEGQGHTYKPERFVDEWAEDLAKWCNYFGTELMASIWSLEGLETARRVNMQRYKIASQMASNYDLCEAIYADGKPVFASFDRHSPHAKFHQDHGACAIWCKSKYPCYPSDIAQTADYPGMPKEFRGDLPWYGYSDHAHGIAPSLLAVSRGARYVEVHFCLGKDDLFVRDTPFAKTPSELAELVRLGREINRLVEVGV